MDECWLNDYREKVWPLAASEMIYVGRATEKKLASYGIYTIGDIANASPDFLKRTLGKNGEQLWVYANGEDHSRVKQSDFHLPVKSIGHGITCNADLETPDEVWKVMLHLSQDIGHKLRVHELCAKGVQITVKDNGLACKQYQATLQTATQSTMEIATLARKLFEANYCWHTDVRAVTVRAINLVPKATSQQLLLFEDAARREKRDKLETAIEDIRGRFGKWAIYPAVLLGERKLPGHCSHDMILPGTMYS